MCRQAFATEGSPRTPVRFISPCPVGCPHSPAHIKKTRECATYSFGIEAINCEFRRLQFCIRHSSEKRQYSPSDRSQAGGDLLNRGVRNHIKRPLHGTTDAARCRHRNSGRGASVVRLPNRKLVAEPGDGRTILPFGTVICLPSDSRYGGRNSKRLRTARPLVYSASPAAIDGCLHGDRLRARSASPGAT
jgi:hypothetical protein